MKRSLRLLRAALVACVMIAATAASLRIAMADDAVPVQLDYKGRPGCPDADTFAREVLARAPRARIATSPEGARSFVVRIHGTEHALEGVLSVRDIDDTTTAARSVHAQSCDELVTALAVITAVIIDPSTARLGAGPSASSAPAPDGVAPTPDAAVAADAAPATPAPDAAAPSGVASAEPSEPQASGPPPSPWSLSAGVGAGVVGGASPSLLLSVPLFVELSRATDGILEPSGRLRFERSTIGGADAAGGGGGGARFGLTTGAADLCPLALRARRLRAQPCVRGEAGGLYAKGNRVEPTHSDVRPWLAFGPIARLRLDLVGPVFAELEGALLALVARDRFVVDGASLVYRPPVVAGTASFAVGVAFW